MSLVDSDLEKLRLYYRPSRIILLLVGESPPPHKGFFYDPTTTEGSLSRNTRKAFEEVFRVSYANRRDFLDQFKANRCYLFDLFKQRGKTIHKANKEERTVAIEELRILLLGEKPKILVSVLKRLIKPVEEAVKRAQIQVHCKALPYPTRQYVKQYRSELTAILSENLDMN